MQPATWVSHRRMIKSTVKPNPFLEFPAHEAPAHHHPHGRRVVWRAAECRCAAPGNWRPLYAQSRGGRVARTLMKDRQGGSEDHAAGIRSPIKPTHNRLAELTLPSRPPAPGGDRVPYKTTGPLV